MGVQTRRPRGVVVLGLACSCALSAVPSSAAATPQLPDPADSVGAVQQPPTGRAAQDAAVTVELQALFDRIEELAEVRIVVDGGLATLTGRTLTHEARAAALELAGGRPGVLYVDDRIEVDTSLSARARPVLDELRERSLEWFVSLPLLLAAAMIVTVFTILARLVGRLRWPFSRLVDSPFAEQLARSSVRGVIFVVGVVLALELLDATALVGAVVGAAGVAGLAFGFAFRNIAENWLAGVLLGLRRPFAPDDAVSIDGQEGKVVRLTHGDTVLMTEDGNHLRIPNAAVFNGRILNFTRNPLRRFRLPFSFARDVDIERVRTALLGALADTPVLEHPAPWVPLVSVADQALTLELRGWVDQTAADFPRTRALLFRRAKEALEAAGLEGPTSDHNVRMVEDGARDATPARGSDAVDLRSAVEEVTVDDALDGQIEHDRRTSADADLLGAEEPR